MGARVSLGCKTIIHIMFQFYSLLYDHVDFFGNSRQFVSMSKGLIGYVCITIILQIRPDDSKNFVFCFSEDAVHYLVNYLIHFSLFYSKFYSNTMKACFFITDCTQMTLAVYCWMDAVSLIYSFK